MAPIKFDDTIKKKLEQRTLQPSSDAWDILSNKLDSHEKKNSRGLYIYIGIAASIVGLLLVSTLFFNSSEESNILPAVADTEIKDTIDNTEVVKAPEDRQFAVGTTNEEDIQKKEAVLNETLPPKSSVKTEVLVANISEGKTVKRLEKYKPKTKVETQESVASVNDVHQREKETIVLHKLSFEDAKAIEIVAEIKKLKTEGNVITDAEIENLLKQAEKDILKQHLYNETTRLVDADALLQDVEDDLEQSFRTKVLEGLKSSYKMVKTAVAQRNN